MLFHYFIIDISEQRISDLHSSLKNTFYLLNLLNNQLLSTYSKVYCHSNYLKFHCIYNDII